MSHGPPWIVCRASFSPAAIRDALRDGVVAKANDEWWLSPESPHWGRAVDLLADVVEGEEQTLLVGPGADVDLTNVAPSDLMSDDAAFDPAEIETWSVPLVVVTRHATRGPLDRWPRDGGELVDLAEAIEGDLWSRVQALVPSLVETSQRWLDCLDERVDRQCDQIDRLAQKLAPDAATRAKLALFRAKSRAKAALARLGTEAATVDSVVVPEVGGAGAARWRTVAGGLEDIVDLDDLANRAIVEFLDTVEAARASGAARRRAADAAAEAARWVGVHGSERLRKAIELQALPLAMGAYRDERLVHLAPLWFWLPEPDEQLLRNPVNPTEAALDKLAAARDDVDGDARLRFHTKSKTVLVVGSLLDRAIWRPAMDWVDDDDIRKVARLRGRSIGPSDLTAALMDEEPF